MCANGMPSWEPSGSHFISALDADDSQNENGKPKKYRQYHELRIRERVLFATAPGFFLMKYDLSE